MQGTDAHAKNYSLMLSDGEVRLAPLYDLGSHAPYDSVNNSPLELAMSIGGEYRIDAVSLDMPTKAGASLGLEAEEARAIAARILMATPDAFAAAADEAKNLPTFTTRVTINSLTCWQAELLHTLKIVTGYSENTRGHEPDEVSCSCPRGVMRACR